MKCILFAFIMSLLHISITVSAQTVTGLPLRLTRDRLKPNLVSMSFERLMGKEALRVVKDSSVQKVDEPTFVRLEGIDFTNGTIQVKVLSRLLKNAPELARGFIGVAFRINEANSSYESIYIRPTNGRATDQVRRNHAIQYYSYPDYKFDRLRKEAPERYEAYSDMTLNEWITLTVVVKDRQAQLYLNNNKQPSLIVNDLKHGAGTSGGVGLWVDIGTEGYFADLTITNQ
ncbi:hypothetical protein J2I48_26145 [Fibrella sp. HMF5036]|uniref:3-keto-disaccharide hydrolase domain-containing protein n=2 Tax=Fibrella aquatilis TaxID=2817059 RepID=A0A939G955_9BACT|nr:hypothetical protein [Fibrella aquatilis]